ncbi:hypothetical protein CKF54_00375 [Psittacicella hinzii]|uniref:Chromosome partition protein Smc n=1 Tax=Psittacicella hinzii TaxID=2028575 RepID=A0A3A1Y9Y1_9GAMM|nr:hypothetical protein [Psittacicella hinzii]RIY34485.1 hypothetical protein CKF54_00375 [Psittacicella hinzii]
MTTNTLNALNTNELVALVQNLLAKVDNLESKVKGYEADHEALVERISYCETECSDLTEKVDGTVESQLDQLFEKFADLEETVEALDRHYDEHNSQLNDLESSVSDLEWKVEKLEETVEDLDDLPDYKNDTANLKDRVDELEEKLSSIEETNQELAENLEGCEEECTALCEEIKELKANVEERLDQHEDVFSYLHNNIDLTIDYMVEQKLFEHDQVTTKAKPQDEELDFEEYYEMLNKDEL